MCLRLDNICGGHWDSDYKKRDVWAPYSNTT
jgi:hypothetical protein